jgi:hypothetical protein
VLCAVVSAAEDRANTPNQETCSLLFPNPIHVCLRDFVTAPAAPHGGRSECDAMRRDPYEAVRGCWRETSHFTALGALAPSYWTARVRFSTVTAGSTSFYSVQIVPGTLPSDRYSGYRLVMCQKIKRSRRECCRRE